VLTTPPQSLYGVAALLEHLAKRQFNDPTNHIILIDASESNDQAMADAADRILAELAVTVRRLIEPVQS
jgi:hypothetical protein